jgi:hypothetical protein
MTETAYSFETDLSDLLFDKKYYASDVKELNSSADKSRPKRVKEPKNKNDQNKGKIPKMTKLTKLSKSVQNLKNSNNESKMINKDFTKEDSNDLNCFGSLEGLDFILNEEIKKKSMAPNDIDKNYLLSELEMEDPNDNSKLPSSIFDCDIKKIETNTVKRSNDKYDKERLGQKQKREEYINSNNCINLNQIKVNSSKQNSTCIESFNSFKKKNDKYLPFDKPLEKLIKERDKEDKKNN